MSLYIPYVRSHISPQLIADLFDYLDIGKTSRVQFIDKHDKYGELYHSAYVYFHYWYETIVSHNFQEQVKEKKARLVYDDPYYLKCFENRQIDSIEQTKTLRQQLYRIKQKCEFLEEENNQLYEYQYHLMDQLIHVKELLDQHITSM